MSHGKGGAGPGTILVIVILITLFVWYLVGESAKNNPPVQNNSGVNTDPFSTFSSFGKNVSPGLTPNVYR